MAAIKRFLVKLGFAGAITEADVGALLEGSVKHAARKASEKVSSEAAARRREH